MTIIVVAAPICICICLLPFALCLLYLKPPLSFISLHRITTIRTELGIYAERGRSRRRRGKPTNLPTIVSLFFFSVSCSSF
ncbi:hypothetical protein F4809DRAFT_622007 [Biscogniauxia mediterranea]|nr:hypothetical protein F4809DRAFT_622007 [Biscogniauxia mediterranea]